MQSLSAGCLLRLRHFPPRHLGNAVSRRATGRRAVAAGSRSWWGLLWPSSHDDVRFGRRVDPDQIEALLWPHAQSFCRRHHAELLARPSGPMRATLFRSSVAMAVRLATMSALPACGARTGLLDSVLTGSETGVAVSSPVSPPAVCATAGIIPPSCGPGGPGMTDCGPGGSGSESCCTSLEVPGGRFYRTYTNPASPPLPDVNAPKGEADPATVSRFCLDKYLVTVGRFRQFVAAVESGWVPPAGSGKHAHLNGGHGLAAAPNVATPQQYEPGWVTADNGNIAPTNANLACEGPFATWTSVATGGQESVPVNCVIWPEAYAFCIWDGGFLPSEAELEYAAAGGSEQRAFPWGSTAPGSTDRYAIYGCYYGGGTGQGTCTGRSNIAPVGTAMLGAGRWGQLDLAGELEEWCLDWHAIDYRSLYLSPCTDCADVTSSSSNVRVARGGDFSFPAWALLPPTNGGGTPLYRVSDNGIRCARAP